MSATLFLWDFILCFYGIVSEGRVAVKMKCLKISFKKIYCEISTNALLSMFIIFFKYKTM